MYKLPMICTYLLTLPSFPMYIQRSVGQVNHTVTYLGRYQPRFRQGDGGAQGSSGRVGTILSGQ